MLLMFHPDWRNEVIVIWIDGPSCSQNFHSPFTFSGALFACRSCHAGFASTPHQKLAKLFARAARSAIGFGAVKRLDKCIGLKEKQ